MGSTWEKNHPETPRSLLFNNQQIIHLLRDSPVIFWDLVKCPKFTQLCESMIRQHPNSKNTYNTHHYWSLSIYTYHHSQMAFSETPNHQKPPSFGYPTINHPPRCHAEPRSVAVDLEIHLHLLEATNHPIALCQSQSYSLLHSCHFRYFPQTPSPPRRHPMDVVKLGNMPTLPKKIGRKGAPVPVPMG